MFYKWGNTAPVHTDKQQQMQIKLCSVVIKQKLLNALR